MHKLEIPENIPLRWELFKGFGAAELFKTCVIAVPVCLMAWLYSQLSSSPMRILTALIIALGGIVLATGLFVKQSYNLSIYDYIRYAVDFNRTQRHYDNIALEVFFIEKEEN